MSVQVNKKFNSIDDGINNMLDAAAHDYSKTFGDNLSPTFRTSDDFRNSFIVKVGQKYIKIGRKSDDDAKFKRGDILKAAGFSKPARNAPRGNVLDGGFNIQWTGPLYL